MRQGAHNVSALLAPSLLLVATGWTQVLHACDAPWSERPPLFEGELRVDGHGRYERRLLLPPGREAIVIASERGVDVTLTVAGEGNAFVADSPLRRFGVQRIVLRPSRATGYVASVENRESDSVSGTVRLRVVSAPAGNAVADCLATQRALARAEAEYARGETLRTLAAPATGGDASQAFRDSTEAYRQALARLDVSREPLHASQVRHALAALAYQGLQDWAAAERWASQAAVGLQAEGDAYGAAKAKAMRAAALMEMAPVSVPAIAGAAPENLVVAVALLREASDFHAARGERYDQALATNNLGIAHYMRREFAAAIKAYRSALELYRALRERTRQWQVMDNLALVEYQLGNSARANAVYAELRTLIDARASPALHLNVLTNSALALAASGDGDHALELYEQALAAAQHSQDRYYEAMSLQGMGVVYEGLGDPDAALALFRRALALRTVEGGAWFRVETLWSIANVLRGSGRAQEALVLDKEALLLATTPLDQQRMQLQIALDYEALRRPQDVRTATDAIVERPVVGGELIRARGLVLRGRAQAGSDPQAADAALREALAVFRKFEVSSEEFAVLVELGRMAGSRGKRDAALRHADAALDLAERMRLLSANPELRASAMQSLRPAFDLKIDLLATAQAAAASPEAGRQLAHAALETAERGRARSLEDYERLDLAATPGAESLLERRRQLYAELGQYRARFEASVGIAAADDGVVDALRRNVADTKRQLDQLDAKLAATSGTPARRASTGLQLAAVPEEAALIEYWLGAEQAYAWVVTRKSLTMLHLGRTSDIVAAGMAAQRALQDVGSGTASDRIARLDALSRLVWHPLSAVVEQGHTLVFVPDAVLHYIPFAALLDATTRHFLIQDHDVATAPSLRLLLARSARTPATTDRLLMVADPVYGAEDARLGRASRVATGTPPAAALRAGDASALRRLPGAAREANAIATLYSPDRTDRLEGLQATKQRFLQAPLQNYRYIHVASHAVADAQIPQLSALLLSSVDAQAHALDGRVLAADLMNVRLNADLVVLSACETALGRAVSGEGIVGLRYVLLARGAKAVASSLWRVADRYTAQLMSRFYTSLVGADSNPLQSMGAAMRAAIAGRDPDPALWAAFDLSIRDLNLVRRKTQGAQRP
jgi:CHAT domain-containing protein/tetratricopeptide (TPR) repeat protein